MAAKKAAKKTTKKTAKKVAKKKTSKASYKCGSCGAKAASKKSCCGKPMKKMAK